MNRAVSATCRTPLPLTFSRSLSEMGGGVERMYRVGRSGDSRTPRLGKAVQVRGDVSFWIRRRLLVFGTTAKTETMPSVLVGDPERQKAINGFVLTEA